MRVFLNSENKKLIKEDELRTQFSELKINEPEEYDYSFEDYINVCCDKNGVLEEVADTFKKRLEDILQKCSKLGILHGYDLKDSTLIIYDDLYGWDDYKPSENCSMHG